MREMAGPGVEIYSEKHLLRLLLERYKGHIVLSQMPGKHNVVCLKDLSSKILNDKWYADRADNIEEESNRVVLAASKLIRAQLRDTVYNTDYYPAACNISDLHKCKTWLPPLLVQFLSVLVSDELKSMAIGHSIVQAARPRSSVSPVLFGLGISLDHCYGSRSLVDTLARFGFSISYDEVNRYKQSAVQCTDDSSEPGFPSTFVQWSGDNMDHILNTLDGQNTSHGMGVIAMTVPIDRSLIGSFSGTPVRRLQRLSVTKLVKNKGIPFLTYNLPENSALKQLTLKPISELHFTEPSHQSLAYDLAWHYGWFCCNENKPRPNWSGFMQHATISTTEFLPKAEIHMLPVIDMNPNDLSCIYSTLCFLELQAKHLNMETACVTFDQLRWLKATNITLTESRSRTLCSCHDNFISCSI